MDKKEYEDKIEEILERYNSNCKSQSDQLKENAKELTDSINQTLEAVDSKIASYKKYLDGMFQLSFSEELTQPSDHFNGIRIIKQDVNTGSLEQLGKDMSDSSKEVKRVNPIIDTDLNIAIENLKKMFASLKEYSIAYQDIDKSLTSLLKEMNEVYDVGHLFKEI